MKQRSSTANFFFHYIDRVSAIFILLFAYTAFSKLLEFSTFQFVLGASPLIGNYANIIAWMLPAAELAVAGLLFFPSTRTVGLKASLLLMTVFTLYLVYMLVFSPELPCSCGGVLKKLSWREHVYFNLILILIAIIALFPSIIYKLFVATNRRSRKPV
ncbi:MauE/DoxX family redox-associated membrane protein [Terrimonas alba]|uniref:MauE/DoxX family redox-associated membrane protein n=1 Tax=Terrimonas alba TaxID=3349636 RepID=UPI0035F298E7